MGHALTVILGIRVAWLAGQYLLGTGAVHRFHVESAAFIFVAVGVIVTVLDRTSAPSAACVSSAIPGWTWLPWCAAATVLYWPALTLGFLSDDFVLADRAMHLRLGALSPEAFRPIP